MNRHTAVRKGGAAVTAESGHADRSTSRSVTRLGVYRLLSPRRCVTGRSIARCARRSPTGASRSLGCAPTSNSSASRSGQSTLSYWQRGLRHPEVPRAISTVRALETVLRLPPESLLALVGPRPQPYAPRPVPAASRAGVHVGGHRAAARVVRRGTGDRAWQRRPRGAVRARHRAGRHAPRTALDHHAAGRARGAAGPGPVSRGAPGRRGRVIDNALVRPGEGCRQGRLRRQSASRGLAVEMLFDRRLADGRGARLQLHDRRRHRRPDSGAPPDVPRARAAATWCSCRFTGARCPRGA